MPLTHIPAVRCWSYGPNRALSRSRCEKLQKCEGPICLLRWVGARLGVQTLAIFAIHTTGTWWSSWGGNLDPFKRNHFSRCFLFLYGWMLHETPRCRTHLTLDCKPSHSMNECSTWLLTWTIWRSTFNPSQFTDDCCTCLFATLQFRNSTSLFLEVPSTLTHTEFGMTKSFWWGPWQPTRFPMNLSVIHLLMRNSGVVSHSHPSWSFSMHLSFIHLLMRRYTVEWFLTLTPHDLSSCIFLSQMFWRDHNKGSSVLLL